MKHWSHTRSKSRLKIQRVTTLLRREKYRALAAVGESNPPLRKLLPSSSSKRLQQYNRGTLSRLKTSRWSLMPHLRTIRHSFLLVWKGNALASKMTMTILTRNRNCQGSSIAAQRPQSSWISSKKTIWSESCSSSPSTSLKLTLWRSLTRLWWIGPQPNKLLRGKRFTSRRSRSIAATSRRVATRQPKRLKSFNSPLLPMVAPQFLHLPSTSALQQQRRPWNGPT